MKNVRSFSAPVSETIARDRIITFMTQAGYRRLLDTNGAFQFKRGSIIGTLSSFNPIRWECKVNVRITSDNNGAEINLVTQIYTDPTEKRFAAELLTAEFDLLEIAVTINEFKPLDVSGLKKRITSHVYRFVEIFGSLIVSVIVGIAIGRFCFNNFSISVFAASAIGAGVFLLLEAIFLVVLGKQKKIGV